MTGRVWWLLTFVDWTQGFLGAAVIEAPDMVSAVAEAQQLGVHPGGQPEGLELGIPFHAATVDPAYVNRLLDREELPELPLPDAAAPALQAGLAAWAHGAMIRLTIHGEEMLGFALPAEALRGTRDHS